MDKPYYPFPAIGSIDTLSVVLGVPEPLLINLANKANQSYISFNITSKSGKVRPVFEPKFELKRLQKRINSRVLEKVIYPNYLQGGIKDIDNKRDYVKNAELHSKAQSIISLDVRDFYPSITEEAVKSIFKYFFSFPDDVSNILTKLCVLNSSLPQGAVCSSYLANLVFVNEEYKLVSKFKKAGFAYSRLLDDITISTSSCFNDKQKKFVISNITSMVTRHGLKIHPDKTKIEQKDKPDHKFEVTGLWVGHSLPKARRSEKNDIRMQVFICEKEFLKDHTSEKYHKLWNKTSGLVAKLTRLNHSQATKLRQRLKNVLPTYNDDEINKIKLIFNRIMKIPADKHQRVATVDKVNQLLYKLSIMARTRKVEARNLRNQIRQRFNSMPLKHELWE